MLRDENIRLVSIKEELKKEIELISQKKLSIEEEREQEIESLQK